ncbi:MAG: SDR family oxidoreductase [Kofleriaceae bacterium]
MQNNVWFVTGASKGLGLFLVKTLLERGYRVAATSRTIAALQEQIGAPTERWLPLEMELTDEASVRAAVGQVLSTFGRLDVVVNNAGYGQMGAVEELGDAEVRRDFEVNVFGTLNVLRATLPHLREQKSGHVFDISSIGGFVGAFSGWGIYCATKFAVAGLTEGLRSDLEPFGIGVTLVYPGYFRTNFLDAGSVMLPKAPIAAYEAARASVKQHLDVIHNNQPGSPAKFADALIGIYEAGVAKAPLHLFLGSDAVAMAEQKLAQVTAEVAATRAIGVSTDF